MPRLRKYNDNDILDKSMVLFWTKGYLGTSLKDLEKVLNLKAPSIYHAFGSKESLFLKVMEYYLHEVVDKRINYYLKNNGNSLNNIKAFFLSLTEAYNSRDTYNGCLLTNTATELGSTNEKASLLVQSGLTKIEGAFYLELQQAQKDKILAPDVNIKDMASVLLVGYQGVLVILRLKYKKEKIQAYIFSILKVLDS